MLLQAVNFTGYCLIRRTLYYQSTITMLRPLNWFLNLLIFVQKLTSLPQSNAVILLYFIDILGVLNSVNFV